MKNQKDTDQEVYEHKKTKKDFKTLEIELQYKLKSKSLILAILCSLMKPFYLEKNHISIKDKFYTHISRHKQAI